MKEQYPHDTIHTHSVEVEDLIRSLRCFPTDADQRLLEEFARRLFHKGHEAAVTDDQREKVEESRREGFEQGLEKGKSEGIKIGYANGKRAKIEIEEAKVYMFIDHQQQVTQRIKDARAEGFEEGLKQAEQKLAAAFRSIIDG